MRIENGYRFLIKQLFWFVLSFYVLAVVATFFAEIKAIEIIAVFLGLSALCARLVYTTLMRCGRTYYVDKDGLTIKWFNHKVSFHPWTDFIAVEERTLHPTNWSKFWPHCIICSIIPIVVRDDGYVNADWPAKHPREVFDIPMSPELCERFWTFVPENIRSNWEHRNTGDGSMC